jgi:hypothetical protein
MANTSLTVFKENGIELVIDTTTGEAFATQRGYSRMSGKAESTISERTLRFDVVKNSEILTSTGLKTIRLIPASLVFKWLLKDNPGLAEKMGEAGATVYMHQIAGYKITSTLPITPKISSQEDRVKLINDLGHTQKVSFDKSLCRRAFFGYGNSHIRIISCYYFNSLASKLITRAMPKV